MSWGWIVIALAIGWIMGWVCAHSAVSDECEKLGSFYVGEKVFRCVKIERKDGNEKA